MEKERKGRGKTGDNIKCGVKTKTARIIVANKWDGGGGGGVPATPVSLGFKKKKKG